MFSIRTVQAAVCALALTALAPASAQPADPHLGRNLAATCANCHGTNGRAVGNMKPLAGVPSEKTLAMLAAYRNGSQPATIMHQIVKGYTDAQLQLIAAYFAAQPASQ